MKHFVRKRQSFYRAELKMRPLLKHKGRLLSLKQKISFQQQKFIERSRNVFNNWTKSCFSNFEL